MASSNRNKQVQCTVCYKSMRSDHLKRHTRKHENILDRPEEEWREELRKICTEDKIQKDKRKRLKEIAHQEEVPADILNNILQPPPPPSLNIKALLDTLQYDDDNDNIDNTEPLEESLRQAQKHYLDTIDLGRQINDFVNKGVVCEDALDKHYKDALQLYRKQKPTRDLSEVKLRPWQQKLKAIIETPTEREIIWVQGIMGNEGKSWFQDHLAALYGYARVVRLDLKLKTSTVLHVLSKRPLCSTDIFLFNERRAMNNETCNYEILESIKDGIAVSSKYNSDILQFKHPNVVVVFSNNTPNTRELSLDRWKIFRILPSELKDITMDIYFSQHK